jgi:DNA-directed RNA polymerase subunit K/omega
MPHVVVNLSAITSVDAGGADALLDAMVATSFRDGTLVLTSLTTGLRQSLLRHGVLPVIETFVDDAVAVAALRSRPTAAASSPRRGSLGEIAMLDRPMDLNSFEFVRIAALRTAQLIRGCVPLVPHGRTPVTTAMREVAAGKVRSTRLARPDGILRNT